MKTMMCILSLLPGLAFAQGQTVERVLKDTTTLVALDLNKTTVFCTSRGYGSDQLKVSVPDLTLLAHFDHRVVGETLPCVTAGACIPGNQPQNMLNPNETVVLAPIRVVLKQELTISEDGFACTESISEHVSSVIKGHSFMHDHYGEPTSVELAKCKMLVNVP